MKVAQKLSIKHIDGPLGVRGRNSDNRLILKLGWQPSMNLKDGLEKLIIGYINRFIRIPDFSLMFLF